MYCAVAMVPRLVWDGRALCLAAGTLLYCSPSTCGASSGLTLVPPIVREDAICPGSTVASVRSQSTQFSFPALPDAVMLFLSVRAKSRVDCKGGRV